jgi:hypothetical protein
MGLRQSPRVRFEVKAETRWGDTVAVVGSSASLGTWDPQRGLKLSTDGRSYPLWRGECVLEDVNAPIEYKVVILRTAGGGVDWEPLASNRSLRDCHTSSFCDWTLSCEWGQLGASLQQMPTVSALPHRLPASTPAAPAAYDGSHRSRPLDCGVSERSCTPDRAALEDTTSPASSTTESPYTQVVPQSYMSVPAAPLDGWESPPPLEDDQLGAVYPRNTFYASPNKSDPLCPIVSVGNVDWVPSPNSSMGDLSAAAGSAD